MAKWGQGDPRWIVEEREDGTNVNNWHWCGRQGGAAGGGLLPGSGEGRPAGAGVCAGPQGRGGQGTRGPRSSSAAGRRARPPPQLGSVLGTERDATSWSKGKFQDLLVGIVVENDAGRGEISELKQVEGEASCSSRKGKLIFFYEWYIKLGWKGIVKESGVKHKGLIEIPNLSEENEVDDTEVNVSKKKGDGDILKDLMKTAGTAKVRQALGDYLKALKTEFTTGMILPTKAMATQELTVKRKPSENTLQVQASSPVALGVRIPTVALHMMELFDTSVEQLYSIFTVKDLVQKFSKSTAVLEAEKGGKFQMFDGNITGEYLELLTNKKIVMKWRCRNWPEGQTELQLDCKGVPVCKEENMKFCWQKQHFEEIKGLLQLTPPNG
ncbi:activator of 90 kDa heat shock protein ATPase homolog 2 isoform X2 [Rhinopithecus roxellana]|uniref:activator of 90 kDa heat shock protein ATPase homolog 2 isoform X2 n=1 Tax=Rhinopithecus roxellana TaxID=61622 RepID=UPI0012373F30|nr:activator of 90 kDa heat shock protein ATPase homolog 2 isoform X2 [Rhinopithecus roxellana]